MECKADGFGLSRENQFGYPVGMTTANVAIPDPAGHFSPEHWQDHGRGEFAAGLAIFCGGIRFFGVPYGLRSVPTGLAEAGFAGRVLYWPWHERWSGPGPALPALWDTALHARHAKAIAQAFLTHADTYPNSPRFLLACSAGGGVALRVLETLAGKLLLDATALLSVAVNPRCDLVSALPATRILLNYHSILDVFLLGVGTLLFGTADRRRCCSAGMVGLRGATTPNVRNMPFRLNMIPSGRLGGHHTAIKRNFIRHHVAPAMGIG